MAQITGQYRQIELAIDKCWTRRMEAMKKGRKVKRREKKSDSFRFSDSDWPEASPFEKLFGPISLGTSPYDLWTYKSSVHTNHLALPCVIAPRANPKLDAFPYPF